MPSPYSRISGGKVWLGWVGGTLAEGLNNYFDTVGRLVLIQSGEKLICCISTQCYFYFIVAFQNVRNNQCFFLLYLILSCEAMFRLKNVFDSVFFFSELYSFIGPVGQCGILNSAVETSHRLRKTSHSLYHLLTLQTLSNIFLFF